MLTTACAANLGSLTVSPSAISCGGKAAITAHLWDAKGISLPNQHVTFTATHGYMASMFSSPTVYDGYVFVGSHVNGMYRLKDGGACGAQEEIRR